MKTLLRYARIYRQLLAVNANLVMVYRANLVNHVINSVVWASFLYIAP